MAMTASFVAVWTPYAVFAVAVLVGGAEGGGGLGGLLDTPAAVLPVVFAKTSTFVNPMLYVVLNKQVGIKMQEITVFL